MDPSYHVAYVVCGLIQLQKKSYAEAIPEFQKARELVRDDPGSTAYLGMAYALSGEKEETKKLMDELNNLSKKKYVPPYYKAALFASLNEKDMAFAHLKKALEERTPWLIFLKIWPIFENLHHEPDFKSLLERMGK